MKRNVIALEISAKEDAIERSSQVYVVEEIVAGRLFEVTRRGWAVFFSLIDKSLPAISYSSNHKLQQFISRFFE